ncbi:MAG: lipopolysaccharide kinase InaA family protein [Lentisphaeria bacterium]
MSYIINNLAGKIPFDIVVKTDQNSDVAIRCNKILRLLPEKRITCEGAITGDGTSCIVKIFPAGFHGKRHYRREIQKLKALQECNIPVPCLYYYGIAEGAYVLVLERIGEGRDFSDELNSSSDFSAKSKLLDELIHLLARQHKEGVFQNDLHPANFVRDQRAIWTIDSAMVKVMPRRHQVGKRRAFGQLGRLLLAYEDEENSEDILRWAFSQYCHYRGWEISTRDFEKIKRRMYRQKLASIRRLLKKSLRSNSRHLALEQSDTRFVLDRKLASPKSFLNFLNGIDDAMEEGKVMKRGNSSFVSQIEIDGAPVVVKRYNYKGLFHAVRHTFKGSRARLSWLNGHRLMSIKIPTSEPLAFVEKRKLGCVVTSYIITSSINGIVLKDYLLRVDQEKRCQVLDYMIRVLNKMRKYKIVHGDLKESNILVQDDGLKLVDLDGLNMFRSNLVYYLGRGHYKDRERFLRNWQDWPEVQRMLDQGLGRISSR